MKVNSKGQVTIPRKIRMQEGFLPGSEVEFVREKGGTILLRKVTSRNQSVEIVSHLRGKGDITMSTDEIMALIQGNG